MRMADFQSRSKMWAALKTKDKAPVPGGVCFKNKEKAPHCGAFFVVVTAAAVTYKKRFWAAS